MPGQELLELLELMWLCRAFEEAVSELYAQGKIAGLLHLGIGQEAVAASLASALRRDDYLYAGHRAHCHALAKGADPKRLLAEIAGRSSGYCGGKGGSMHIMAADIGFLGATGVVGGNIPLALGSAFVCRERARGQVVAVCFGDGAAQVSYFHESLNIASLWKLPVVFICENNGWAEFTPLAAHTVVDQLAKHATPYGMPHLTGDGNNVFEAREAIGHAIERARSGSGPTLVELLTYRLSGHYVGDPARYREASEVLEWKKRDPIARLQEHLRNQQGVSPPIIQQAEERARSQVREAVQFVLAAPVPSPDEVDSQVYA